MPLFVYRALTSTGERVSGEIEAADDRSAVARLQDRGLIPISAEPVRARATAVPVAARGLARAVTEATRELATLLEAGQPVEAALGLLIETGEQRRLRAVLAEIGLPLPPAFP